MALEISRRDARRPALRGLIDYAGLFPPTSLEMVAAVAEYRAARTGSQSWLVDRFICPANRLVELAAELIVTMRPGEPPWPLVVTATAADRRVIEDFAAELGRSARVDAVEMLLPTEADAAAVATLLIDFGRTVFFEVPWQQPSIAARLDVLDEARGKSGRRLGAKIRCGGVTADAFPPVAKVAEFIVECARRRLPLKATAGLHHPIRHTDPGTGFAHHGFLNLLTAAALAHSGGDLATVEEAIADADATDFTMSATALRWREHEFSAEALEAMRSDLFVGYGSCSIAEPVADLTALGMLPVSV